MNATATATAATATARPAITWKQEVGAVGAIGVLMFVARYLELNYLDNEKETHPIQSLKTSGVAIALATTLVITYKVGRQVPGMIRSNLPSLKNLSSSCNRTKEPVPTFEEGIVVSRGGGKTHPRMTDNVPVRMYMDHDGKIRRTSFLAGKKVEEEDADSFKPNFKIELKEFESVNILSIKSQIKEMLGSDTFELVVASKARTSQVTVYIKSDKDIATLKEKLQTKGIAYEMIAESSP